MGPLQLTVTWYKNRHVGTQETHWDTTNKELTSFKMVIFFVCFVPVRLLRPNMAVFVPCDCKLQRAYCHSTKQELETYDHLSAKPNLNKYRSNLLRRLLARRTEKARESKVP